MRLGYPKRSRQSDKVKAQVVLSSELQKNLQNINSELQYCADLITREFEVGENKKRKMALIHLQGISNGDTISQFVVDPILHKWKNTNVDQLSDLNFFNELKDNTFDVPQVKTETEWNNIMMSLLNGDTAIFLDHQQKVLLIDTKGGQFRSVSESTGQTIIRGPKDSFTESIATNMSLLRYRIRNTQFKMEMLKVGDITNTNVVISYLDDKVDEELLKSIKEKVENIKINGVLETINIESLIETKPYSPFPTVLDTERPDVIAANILEGRIGLFVDGSPIGLIIPATLPMFFQSPDDYNQRYIVGTSLRLLRLVAFFISLLFSACFLALITHHPSMIPTPLMVSLAAQRESVPFPAIVELLLLEFAFEIIREASIRSPRVLASTVAIVGALVIGQAVVQAGIVSTAMIIVVSITGISSFTIPNYSIAASARLVRYLFIISAGVAGLYGIALMFLFWLVHLNTIDSFGVPYLMPISPLSIRDNEDTLIHIPKRLLKTANEDLVPDSSRIRKKHKNKIGEENESNS
ncbi:spore germination protein [Bacillus sp. AFS017336]|uniref:spore germination protein n=1 Tax=Bacillus sp. AFS017336 TaxID=2033489 RepID=UPI000BF0F76D|nr:spore germination protein [Bacillus sp. AFS017336]PEL10480.1 spore germination protein [Bacillus sp. AFS017336]